MPTYRILALVVAAVGCGSQAPPVANKRDGVVEPPLRAECVRAVAWGLFLQDLEATIGTAAARDIGLRSGPPADEDEARAMLRPHDIAAPGESGPLIERCMQRPRVHARCRLRATTLDELRECPT